MPAHAWSSRCALRPSICRALPCLTIPMICHDYKCVFIHIPKNAGQSIETVFLSALNLTWETRFPLFLRPNHDPSLGPPRLAHLKAREYVSCGHLSPSQFDSYFKFAFVRNPWDRAVSLYKYIGLRKGLSFKQFVAERLRGDLWKNWRWFVGPQADFVCHPNGTVLVDFLGRFENLQADFQHVCRRLHLLQPQLPHVNKSKGPKFSLRRVLASLRDTVTGRASCSPCHYSDYYDDETKNIVSELYHQDGHLFGYHFDRNPAFSRLRPALQA